MARVMLVEDHPVVVLGIRSWLDGHLYLSDGVSADVHSQTEPYDPYNDLTDRERWKNIEPTSCTS